MDKTSQAPSSKNDAFAVFNNGAQRSVASYGLSLNRNNHNDSLHKTMGLSQGENMTRQAVRDRDDKLLAGGL